MVSTAAADCTAPVRAQAAAPGGRVSARPVGGVPALPRGTFLGRPLWKGPMVAASNTKMPQAALRVQAVAGEVMVDVDKPLGLRLAESSSANGGLVVKSASGNAAKAGVKTGDTVIYTSSYFGDELWPADNINFTRSALARCPSPVTIIFVRGENISANVKRLPKRKAPPRFGRKLSPGQLELATHVCVDCGYVYCQRWAPDCSQHHPICAMIVIHFLTSVTFHQYIEFIFPLPFLVYLHFLHPKLHSSCELQLQKHFQNAILCKHCKMGDFKLLKFESIMFGTKILRTQCRLNCHSSDKIQKHSRRPGKTHLHTADYASFHGLPSSKLTKIRDALPPTDGNTGLEEDGRRPASSGYCCERCRHDKGGHTQIYALEGMAAQC